MGGLRSGADRPVRRRAVLKLLKFGMDTWEFLGRSRSRAPGARDEERPGDRGSLRGGFHARWTPVLRHGIRPGHASSAIRISYQCARVELMIQTCRAVQHAQERRVIHRDLKPSNLLVVWNHDTPSVKVINFGIPKAMTGADRPHLRHRVRSHHQHTGLHVLRGQSHLRSGPGQTSLQGVPQGDHHLLPGRREPLGAQIAAGREMRDQRRVGKPARREGEPVCAR
jgi:hypothetical protein